MELFGVDLTGLIYSATLLFFIFDPFASLPIFIALTKNYKDEDIVKCANRAVMVSAVLFIVFILIGAQLLSLFGITFSGFRIAGGLVLLLMALEIIFGVNLVRSGDQNVAWVIVATPVLTGPGVITTAIILTVQYDWFTVLVAGAISLLITWALLRNASSIIRMIGNNAIEVFSKVVGLLIAAMAIEYIMTGVSNLALDQGFIIAASLGLI